MKQYLLNKAHSWGLKVFCRCGSNGFLHDMSIASDSSLEIKNGFGYIRADVVLKLFEESLKHQGHKVFFDNYLRKNN
ncbi:hypothetical protein T11_1887 [Trichinella zimbabwensis]|uniref:PiggyBac transposable element-derived protein domain-containing protein n=1 Tax=Trichinella zimbabwensis TaxID=268475 RepID=A0A0V1I1Y1_9BILA|nr:hypothetical protein T11_1887 [Trichinella zimbabwensis]